MSGRAFHEMARKLDKRHSRLSVMHQSGQTSSLMTSNKTTSSSLGAVARKGLGCLKHMHALGAAGAMQMPHSISQTAMHESSQTPPASTECTVSNYQHKHEKGWAHFQ